MTFTSARIDCSFEFQDVESVVYKSLESTTIRCESYIPKNVLHVFLNNLPMSIDSTEESSSVASIDLTGLLDLCEFHESVQNIDFMH